MPNAFDRYGTPPRAAAPAPATPPTADAPDDTGLVWKVLDVMGRPGRAVAGATREALAGGDVIDAIGGNLSGRREDTFDDVLADQGVEDGFGRRALGFGLDLVADPLNLIPVTPIAKGLKTIGQFGKTLGQTALRSTAVGADLEKLVVPFAGLEKFTTVLPDAAAYGTRAGELAEQGKGIQTNYRDLRRLHATARDARREQAAEKALQTFPDITPEQGYEIALGLDEGRALADPRLEEMRQSASRLFDTQFEREVGAGVMPEGRKLDNYVTHLMRADPLAPGGKIRDLSAKNPFIERTGPTFAQGVKAGIFEPDIRRITADRLAKGSRSVVNAEFLDTAAKQFGRKVDANGVAPAGYREAALAGDDFFKSRYAGVAFPEEIATDIEKLDTIPDQAGAVRDLVHGATAIYKGWLTRANPAFHVGNAASNMVQTWMGGLGDTGTKVLAPFVVLKKHAEAFEIAGDVHKVGNVGNYQAADIAAALKDYGIVGGAHTSFNELDDVLAAAVPSEARTFGERAGRAVDHTIGPNSPLLKAGAKVGNRVENTSRVALFLDQLEKGKSTEEAALHVKKYLFDYGELTDAERTVRDYGMPFYTWMRKNIPLQVANLVENPDKLAALGHGVQAQQDYVEDAGFAATADQTPDYLETDYRQAPFQGDNGEAVFLNPRLPVQDLNIFDALNPTKGLGNTTEVLREEIGAGLSPWLRMPIELMTNREMYSGRDIAREGQTLAPADPLTAAIGPSLPEGLQEFLGMAETKRGVEIDPRLAYFLRQNPIGTRLGKVIQTQDESRGSIGGVTPGWLSMMLGPTSTIDEVSLRKNAIRARQERQRAEAVQRQERRRTLPVQ